MPTGYPSLFVVAVAMIAPDGRVLVQQRPPGKAMAGLWEFPGGKVEPGETPEQALVREIDEELGVTLKAAALEPLTFASEPLAERHLILLLYVAREWTGEARALDASAIRWVTIDEMRALPMPPADAPFADALARLGL